MRVGGQGGYLHLFSLFVGLGSLSGVKVTRTGRSDLCLSAIPSKSMNFVGIQTVLMQSNTLLMGQPPLLMGQPPLSCAEVYSGVALSLRGKLVCMRNRRDSSQKAFPI